MQINDVINDEAIEDAIVTNILRKMQPTMNWGKLNIELLLEMNYECDEGACIRS